MELFNERSIKEIRKEKEDEINKSKSMQSIASELADTKIKLMRSDSINKNLSEEIVGIKLDIMQIKGGSL